MEDRYSEEVGDRSDVGRRLPRLRIWVLGVEIDGFSMILMVAST